MRAVVFLYQGSRGLILGPQNKACNWVWACPLSPLFDGKRLNWKRGKTGCLALPHPHACGELYE